MRSKGWRFDTAIILTSLNFFNFALIELVEAFITSCLTKLIFSKTF